MISSFRWLRIGVPMVIFLSLMALFWLGLSQDPHRLPSMLINKPVPSLQAKSLHHDQVITDKILLGHITVLNVWASWCEACQREHAQLLKIHHHQHQRDKNHLQIVGLNYKDQDAAAKTFLQQLGNPYDQVLVDHQGEIAMNLGVYGTPETFIIDQEGLVRYRHAGLLTAEVWRDELLPIIHQLAGGAA